MNLSRRNVLSSILSVLGLPTFAKPLLGETYLPGYSTSRIARVGLWQSDTLKDEQCLVRCFKYVLAVIREDDQGVVWWVWDETTYNYIEHTPREHDFIEKVTWTEQKKYELDQDY